MSSGGANGVVAVPLLEAERSESCSHGNPPRNKGAVSIGANSFGLPAHPSGVHDAHTQRLQAFQRTVQVLQLDHSHYRTLVLSWIIGLLLVVVIPVLRLFFVKAVSGESQHELVFQPLSVLVGIALSTVSFLFLTQSIRRHGLRGVLFLDAAELEGMEVQEEYDTIIEKSRMLLAKLFIPSFLVYAAFRAWFYIEVALEPLPFETKTTALSLIVIISLTTLSWIFQTTTYLYSCTLFSTVCSLQELKMLKFKTLLEHGLDPEYYFSMYTRIVKGLHATSRRFRAFLGLIFAITVVGFLASMYKVVEAERAGIATLMTGEIVLLNLVNLTGVGLCLSSSSKLSHLHRRIVKAAASMHARLTFEPGDFTSLLTTGASNDSSVVVIIQKLSNYFLVQDACSQRAALVNYLSSMSIGISVYGFVLDRFFIHASVGALVTTMWFILGRSLND